MSTFKNFALINACYNNLASSEAINFNIICDILINIGDGEIELIVSKKCYRGGELTSFSTVQHFLEYTIFYKILIEDIKNSEQLQKLLFYNILELFSDYGNLDFDTINYKFL